MVTGQLHKIRDLASAGIGRCNFARLVFRRLVFCKQHRQLLEDIEVISEFDQYRLTDDFDLLQKLEASGVFYTEGESDEDCLLTLLGLFATLIGPMASSLVGQSPLPRTFQELDQLAPEQRNELRQKKVRFEQLTEEQQHAYRSFNSRLNSAENSQQLRK